MQRTASRGCRGAGAKRRGRPQRETWRRARVWTGSSRRHRPSASRLRQRVDSFEAAVALQDGQEDFVAALVLVRAELELDAVEVESAALGDGIEQRLAGDVTR